MRNSLKGVKQLKNVEVVYESADLTSEFSLKDVERKFLVTSIEEDILTLFMMCFCNL